MTTRAYVESLFADGQHVEVRHQCGEVWESVWCSGIDELRQCYRDRRERGNLFASIQHAPTPADGPITNDLVDRYVKLFFDLDPERPKNSSSTNSELMSSIIRAKKLRHYLSLMGWPVPAIGVSGNGCHLYYRCCMPNSQEIGDMLKVVYDGLARRFSDGAVKLDRAVRNAGRISALFGTVKRKGRHTSDRPHRKSWVQTPRYWSQVTMREVEKLSNNFRHRDESVPIDPIRRVLVADGMRGDFTTLDSLGWFDGKGKLIGRVSEDIYGVRCPWQAEHSTPSPKNGSDTVIIKRAGRWDIFSCRHDHCADRRMIDVVRLWGDADAYCSKPYTPERNNEEREISGA